MVDHLYPPIYMGLFSRYGDDSRESLVVFLLDDYLLLLQLWSFCYIHSIRMLYM